MIVSTGVAFADDAGDSGLRGHRFRVGVGASTTPEHLGGLFQTLVTPNDTGGVDIGLGIPGTHFEAIKADYTFFRPTRQEGLVTVYAIRSHFDAFAYDRARQTLVTVPQQATILAAVPEYRERFFGHGFGYAGIGAGAANRGLVFPGVSAVVTGAVGIDIGRAYLEARSLYFRREDAAFTSLFVGGRF